MLHCICATPASPCCDAAPRQPVCCNAAPPLAKICRGHITKRTAQRCYVGSTAGTRTDVLGNTNTSNNSVMLGNSDRNNAQRRDGASVHHRSGRGSSFPPRPRSGGPQIEQVCPDPRRRQGLGAGQRREGSICAPPPPGEELVEPRCARDTRVVLNGDSSSTPTPPSGGTGEIEEYNITQAN
ncbi:hypothetical protein ZWY2020_051915 [Hordeum vulgare]|nr:hypothetical protein ZWY2020_051915 [Hordeum vulgare]